MANPKFPPQARTHASYGGGSGAGVDAVHRAFEKIHAQMTGTRPDGMPHGVVDSRPIPQAPTEIPLQYYGHDRGRMDHSFARWQRYGRNKAELIEPDLPTESGRGPRFMPQE